MKIRLREIGSKDRRCMQSARHHFITPNSGICNDELLVLPIGDLMNKNIFNFYLLRRKMIAF
jgi:hypothetical protein